MHTGIDVQYATNGAEKHEGYYLPVVWQLGEHTTAPCRLGMKIQSSYFITEHEKMQNITGNWHYADGKPSVNGHIISYFIAAYMDPRSGAFWTPGSGIGFFQIPNLGPDTKLLTHAKVWVKKTIIFVNWLKFFFSVLVQK